MPIAVPTSWLVPASIARIAVSDSRTPPAQDWMSVFMSARKPFRSAARCDCDGCTRDADQDAHRQHQQPGR